MALFGLQVVAAGRAPPGRDPASDGRPLSGDTRRTGDAAALRGPDAAAGGPTAGVAPPAASFGGTSPCATTTRWDLTTSAAALQPMWRDVTGGDTTTAVAITVFPRPTTSPIRTPPRLLM